MAASVVLALTFPACAARISSPNAVGDASTPSSVTAPPATDPAGDAEVQLTVASTDQDAAERITRRVRTYLAALPDDTPVNVVAIGSDRTTGDALGPFVGDFLRSSRRYRVIGSLDDPVTALNLPLRITGLQGFTIAVDAALGAPVGDVTVRRGALDPGQALGNPLPPVGDVAVSGLVAEPGADPFEQLRSAALGDVRALARVIAEGLAAAVGEEIDATVPG